ncbi:MAG: sulfite exporter TauE/SafE family protein [Gammaproteobacteria bacterium]|jgi:hypothetical protein|nr:sulfite exporter TauE/SafE family protein [Gammaproteobacteria bacterium]
MEPLTTLQYAAIFAAGAGSGFVNVMAGGGSALTLPLLIFFGMDASVANGTNRIAILAEAGSAVASYHKRSYSEFRTSLGLALLTLPGAVLGAFYASRIDDALFEKVLGMVMLFIVASLLFDGRIGGNSDSENRWRRRLTVPVMIGIGFYGGFVQAGVGFLLMWALRMLGGLDLVRVNMHKVFIVFFYSLPVISIFVATGNVDWIAAVVLSAGMGLGAWWSAHVSVKGGEGIVKRVLSLVLLLMAVKLWF